MRLAVTGGLGFIGSHLVERLANQGKVSVLDNRSSGTLENIANFRESPNLTVLDCDIRNAADVELALRGVDSVVHLAAVVSVAKSIEYPGLAAEVNVNGTLNVLNACLKNKVRRLVFASTAAVYGGAKRPAKEDDPLVALSPYAASKVAGEAFCRAYWESYGIETVILRFFNVYGPRSTGPYAGVMVKFAQAIKDRMPPVIFGDGEQTRDFVHVSDVVNAIVLAIGKKGISGETYNVGTGIGTTVNQLAHAFFNAAGVNEGKVSQHVPRKSEVRSSVADITKAKEGLGYSPKVDLAHGVEEYLTWFLSQ
jgi:UDP-glucose 4-epimerase